MTTVDAERQSLQQRILSLIATLEPSVDEGAPDRIEHLLLDILLEIARWQARHVEPYRRLLLARGFDPDDLSQVEDPAQLPAIPTDIFRAVRVAAHGESQDVRCFLTSGTTGHSSSARPTLERRGRHFLRDLTLYDHAAERAARYAFFPDLQQGERMRLVLLVASEKEAPHSSLGYMLARYGEWFGSQREGGIVYAWRGTLGEPPRLDIDKLAQALDAAEQTGQPIALLGTSFAYVHAEETLERRWRLPAGSRLLHTGGTKGLSREVEPAELRAQLSARYGLPETHVVAEYGMTELSSQLYETTLRDAIQGRTRIQPRRLWAPPWLRVRVVDPVSLQPVPAGETGLVRIEDPANLDTAWAVQTSDLGRLHPADSSSDGTLELLGRAVGAVPRGCSLAVEAILRPEARQG